MDRNKIIAIALMAALYCGFIYLNMQEQKKYESQQEAYEASKPKVENVVTTTDPASATAGAAAQGTYESQMAAAAEAQDIVLENDVMKVTFSTLGAQIKSVELKDYTKYAPNGDRTELVKMFDPETAKMDLSFYVREGLNNLRVNTMERNFEVLPSAMNNNAKFLVFRLPFEGGAYLEYTYVLHEPFNAPENSETEARKYMLDFQISMEGMTPILSNQSALNLAWSNTSYQNEKGYTNEKMYTTVAYHYAGENSIEELATNKDEDSEQLSTSVEWVAFKQQFFTSAMILPEGGFSTADLRYTSAAEGSGYMMNYTANLTLALSPENSTYKMGLYFGPNKYSVLGKVNDLGYGELAFEQLVPLGWGIFGWVNKWLVIPVFDFLMKYISSFGLIILILSVLIKLIIFPMTYSSYISMAKMRVIKPEMDEIAKKYPRQEDMQKKQKANMELYQKTGINPVGGCLPMLIQMPILIAMFRFFPASIELRDKPFLWADDLSSYDSIATLPFEIPFYGDHVSLFALLMTVVLFVYSLMNYNQTSSSTQMPGMKFMMVYMMPLMMLFWFNSYSSGLCYYYFLTNLLTIAQTIGMRRLVDDNKIHAILKANAAKRSDGKKSKFQQRYEELMSQAENNKQQK